MLNVIFMGTPSYATEIFKVLQEDDRFNVQALFTQPDKPVGRKKVLTPPHIKQYCHDNGLDIAIHQPNSLKEDEVFETIDALNPDVIVVAAYGQIVPKRILDRVECINLHASILPKYRGASPIQDSILNGDQFTGVTAMKMDVGLDTGDIIGIRYLKIDEETKVDTLFEALSTAAAELTIKTLTRYERTAYPQSAATASKCSKISKKDGEVSFRSAKEVYQAYKAYFGWPTIHLASGLKIIECELLSEVSSNQEGEVIAMSKEGVTIGCIEGELLIKTVQAPSKKPMSASDYLRGQRIEVGAQLS
jgi:methionyl-tRNA formyltransferase